MRRLRPDAWARAWLLCPALVALGLAALQACERTDAPPSDRAEARPALYDGGPPLYPGVVRTSRYLGMRDGVKIAVDVYLPEGLAEGTALPAIVHQTRYWRSHALRWPFSSLLDEPSEPVSRFVTHGYAWVGVDARGSGASFGQRPHPWSPDETRDGAEVVDWIVAQPWSNGRVGSFGTSYDGTAAEFLVTNRHPAVVAAAPRFSLFDAFADIAFPGGLQLAWFTENWGRFNRDLDRNHVPAHLFTLGGWKTLLLAGVRPVEGDDGAALLAQALRDHEANWDVHAMAQTVVFRDDTDPEGRNADVFSPHRYVEAIDASGTAIYSWSGWFDGGYQHAAVKRHLTLKNPDNKLILGPWNHGGASQVRGGRSEESEFDHVGELLKFFDHHLAGRDTGLSDDAPVHYYTLVEGRWKAAEQWPPEPLPTTFYFAADGNLAVEPPADSSAFDSYTVDTSHGTGDRSRWNSLMGLPVNYPDRADADARLLVYTTPPLAGDTEVTGHPRVQLYVASTASDGAFFAYLEDVAPEGSVTYVTEGGLRALHRRHAQGTPPYRDAVPYRSFARSDGEPLVPGQVAELAIDLLPTSYLFRKGHRIRIALAGADRDHFALVPPDAPPTWQVYRDAVRPSRLTIPYIPPQ